jgi:hypothetical protein
VPREGPPGHALRLQPVSPLPAHLALSIRLLLIRRMFRQSCCS